MSSTSYRPACASAQNTGIISPVALGVKLGFIKDNRFLFGYEHSKIIYDRCLDHISTCQLSARCFRILNIILRQTVGFGKLEDHATTTRLEQLTKIRHDHIGNALRYLAKRNIIKWRKGGRYNNYLSINYDFASWGERNPDKQNPNNDPTILLPDYYIKTPIDQGLCFDDDDQEDKEFLDIDTEQQEESPSKQEVIIDNENCLTQTVSDAEYLDKNAVIEVVSEVVDNKLSQLEQLIKQYSPVEKSAEIQATTVESQTKTDQIPAAKIEVDQVNTVLELEQQKQTIENYQKEITELKQQSEHAINEVKQQSKQAIDDLKQQSKQEITELKQHTEQVQLENNRLHEKQIEAQHKNQVTESQISQHFVAQNISATHNLDAMDYPLQLSENDCISAKTVVIKSPQRAQDILDLLAIRLNQTQPVLNNPIAYLARLVQKEQCNELDFSALQTFVRPQLIQRDLQNLIHTHNNDYGQYKAYGEAVESHDLQSDDPDNVAEFERLQGKHLENFDKASASYLSLKDYVAEYQLDQEILEKIDSNNARAEIPNLI